MDKNNKIKAMICPVCGEYYFSDSCNDDTDTVDQCRHCGWFYDLKQYENPNLKGGNNVLSLNEYRKQYTEMLSKNPKYDYSDEHVIAAKPHLCPVCGEFEFVDVLSSCICPICGWEDNGYEENPDFKPSPFIMSFNEHKEWFRKKRTENPKFKWKNNK